MLKHLAAHPATRAIAKQIEELSGPDRTEAFTKIIERAVLMKDIVRLTLRSSEQQEADQLTSLDSWPRSLDLAYRMRRLPAGLQIVAGDKSAAASEPRRSLIKAVVRGYSWRQRIERGEVNSYTELAQSTGVTRRYVARILRLGYIAPDLVEAILYGEQDPALAANCAMRMCAKREPADLRAEKKGHDRPN